METTKETYWKYSLMLLILLLGGLIVVKLWSFVSGLLGAFTLFVLVRRQMIYLTERKRVHKVAAALLIMFEAALCVLVPVCLVIWVLLGKVQAIHIDIPALTAMVQHFDALLQEKWGYSALNMENMAALTGYLTKGLQFIIGQAGELIVTTVVMIFLLYFMLVGHREIERYIYDLLPFSEQNRWNITKEIYRMVRTNAIGIPLLALMQGSVAYAGYLIFGVPSAFLFAILTCFATIIPLVGTGLVWVPLVVYLLVAGNWGEAFGLTVYSLVLLINIDNVIRFLLQKHLADTHPLITVFGVILGLSVFGFWGVIFGPLLLSLFLLLVNMFKREYLDGKA
ncbi:MAG: AI-2E family transporter [Tannerella sp.]|jgi:predicted PurR-regulated permease PerM|nr:AI-2E family transporter [Tannerella sp.]